MPALPRDVARFLPIFKVWADDGKHPSVALNKPVCVIGRSEAGVNLPLQAPEVSKLHALVVRTHGRVYVRDLASRNGVQRNGAPVQEVGLSDEDVLRIGSYTLRCASGFGHAQEGDFTPDDAPAEPAAPDAELIDPDGVTYPFPRGRQTLLIGHRDGCEVRLEADEEVAPVHAILFEIDGQHFVRDLGAPNGTRLNHKSIHQSPLKPGDEIRVGGVTLRYALVHDEAEDEADGGDDEAAAVRNALGADDSAPGIDLGDSATSANIGISDSVLGPEITIEDSRVPGGSTPGREPSAISEYDFDVVDSDADADARRESTFAGEVVGTGTNPVTAEDAKPARPELPGPPAAAMPPTAAAPPATDALPAAAAAGAVIGTGMAPLRMDDSSIPIAGSFHDRLVDDDLLKGPAAPAPAAAASAPPQAPPAPPTTMQPPAATAAPKAEDSVAGDAPIKVVVEDEADEEPISLAPTPAPAAPAVAGDASKADAPKADAPLPAAAVVTDEQQHHRQLPEVAPADTADVEQLISQLVEEVTERVEQVSEKVEMVAAKVERVAAKMTEVTKDVRDVAQTAGTLQEVWSDFRDGDADGHPGAAENSGGPDRGPSAKSLPERDREVAAKPASNPAPARNN